MIGWKTHPKPTNYSWWWFQPTGKSSSNWIIFHQSIQVRKWQIQPTKEWLAETRACPAERMAVLVSVWWLVGLSGAFHESRIFFTEQGGRHSGESTSVETGNKSVQACLETYHFGINLPGGSYRFPTHLIVKKQLLCTLRTQQWIHEILKIQETFQKSPSRRIIIIKPDPKKKRGEWLTISRTGFFWMDLQSVTWDPKAGDLRVEIIWLEGNTWRIIPVSKWLITMVSKSPK